MRCDWDLIRLILLRLEAFEDLSGNLFANSIQEYPEAVVQYHFWLIHSAGLAEGLCNGKAGGADGIHCRLTILTWKGHEFLSQIRTDTAWQRVRRKLAEKAVDLSFDAILAAGRAVLRTIE